MAEDEFDCPTGNCGSAEPDPDCKSVKAGDTVEPNSKAHTERNRCNRCPKSPPRPVYITKPGRIYGTRQVLSHWTDDEGNIWAPDNAATAWWYHDDPFPGFRDKNNMTFRVKSVASGGKGGWQCRYENGVLDDASPAMGTYDYAEAGTSSHWSMDVSPHNANGNYVPNLTEQY